MADTTLPEINGLLHEPARLRLMAYLSVVKRVDFTYLLNLSGMTRGNLSVQMGKLRDAELVNIEKTFRGNRPCTMYRLTGKGIESLRKYKRDMTELLAALPD